MKLKGINPFEQHVEKIVVAGIAVVGLGVLSAQFLGSSNLIKVGNEDVSPEGAYGPVKTAAETLSARVKSPSPALPDVPKTDVLAKFEQAVSGGVSPAKDLAGSFAIRPNIGQTRLTGTASGDTDLAEVSVPAPSVPVARTSVGAIDPVEWATNPGVRPFLPPDQPFDKFSVSVEVLFDGKAFKDALTNDPDGPSGPIQPIPLGWVSNNVEILGVEVEREQISASGSAPAKSMLKPIPGRPDLLDEVSKTVKGAGDMPRVLDNAKAFREGILRPAFYSYVAGEPWAAPTDLQEGGAASERVAKAEKKLALVRAELEKLRVALDKQRNPAAERQPAGGPSGGGGGGKGASGGGGGQPPPRREQQPATEKKPVKTMLERNFEKKELEEASLATQLEALKSELAGDKPTLTGVPLPILDDPKVRLWAHDLQAEPGATYRYRARVVTNNPLFGREAAMKESQKARAKEPVLRGVWSDWSESIAVDQKTYYFVTGANERDNLGPARVSAELMQFYYGFYRKATLPAVNPGDLFIGEAKLPPELVIYDLKKIAEGARPAAEATLAGGPGGEDERGGGRARSGGGKGRGEVGAEVVAPSAAPTAPPKDGLTKPGPEKLTMSMDAMLLDVASGPAPSAASIGKVASVRAFIRERTGQIVVRSSEQRQDDAVFQRVSRSAALGETQGKPKVVEKKPDAGPEGERPPGREAPPPPPDGGGGGGGG